MGKNRTQLAAEARLKDTTPAAVADQPEAQTAAMAPAAPVADKPVADKPAVPLSKQETTILKLAAALREKRQIEVKPEMLQQDGKFINVVVGKDWPTIRIGTSGGVTVLELKSYPNAFDAAVDGDKLLAKQVARDQKKQAVAAPAPAKQQEAVTA